ncbi:MAG: hypothetical protein ACTSR1_02135, partial [Candidatus Heimdallarchaeota archaeon]
MGSARGIEKCLGPFMFFALMGSFAGAGEMFSEGNYGLGVLLSFCGIGVILIYVFFGIRNARSRAPGAARTEEKREMLIPRSFGRRSSKAIPIQRTENLNQNKTETIIPNETDVLESEIQKVKAIIGQQTMVSVDHIWNLTGMFKGKIIYIATMYLDFVLFKDDLVKYADFSHESEQDEMVKKVTRAIGTKEEVHLGYLKVTTDIPKDKLIEIIKYNLGLNIIDDMVIIKDNEILIEDEKVN